MLDWLKDEIRQGADEGGRILIAKAMQEHFASLEKIKLDKFWMVAARDVVHKAQDNHLDTSTSRHL